jgi:hypothetical protein
MSFSQLPEFAVLAVSELGGICASLELLTDPMALGRIGVHATGCRQRCKGSIAAR